MAITDIDWGTVTLTNGSTAVTGSGTSWIADDIRDGDTFVFVDGGDGFQQPIVASVQSNTALTLRNAWEGPTLTATTYTLRYQWDSSRVSAMSRRLIMILDNGNIEAFAALTGPGVAVFNGPHSMEVRPFTDFVNGVTFNVQVDTLADRAAYDGQTQGFTVLVSDMGDGRSAVFTKNSNTSADWSDAAYITGPVGPLPEVEATVAMLPPGSTPVVTGEPITGGVRLEFELPEASGFNFVPGGYDIGEAYDKDDVVTHNRSSFIALQSVPVGESPSSTFPPVDTAYWGVLVEAGQDGTGTGDVVGPASSTANGFAGFDGTTGKLIKELTAAQATSGLDTFDEGIKGLVPGPTSGDISDGKFLKADGTWAEAVGGTGALLLPSGTTAQRPSSPVNGMIRYSTTFGAFEAYEDGIWVIVSTEGIPYEIEYLVVAGGGGGGANGGGGGGAGGVLSGTTSITPETSIAVVVGGGGAGGGASLAGTTGSNSSLGSGIVATGGGGGANISEPTGQSGGSGGGGTINTAGGSGISGQGNAGGSGFTNATGGGGGANAVGGSASSGVGGSGGSGVSSDISGTTKSYGGGGGGFGATSTGSGGVGGGGNASASGTANTGGGGGAYIGSGTAGSGGSGIVIISYPGPQRATGGTVTSVGGNTIHTFTGSGTLIG